MQEGDHGSEGQESKRHDYRFAGKALWRVRDKNGFCVRRGYLTVESEFFSSIATQSEVMAATAASGSNSGATEADRPYSKPI